MELTQGSDTMTTCSDWKLLDGSLCGPNKKKSPPKLLGVYPTSLLLQNEIRLASKDLSFSLFSPI